MAYSVEFSRRAERDLGEIFTAINAEQSQAAARWFDGLQTHIEKLATLPDRGTLTRYDSKLRFLLYGNKPHVYRISTAWTLGLIACSSYISATEPARP